MLGGLPLRYVCMSHSGWFMLSPTWAGLDLTHQRSWGMGKELVVEQTGKVLRGVFIFIFIF